MISKYDVFIFDLDGTLYLNESLIPKANETINQLTFLNKKLVFVSNKTTGLASDYHKILTRYGIEVSIEQFITSTMVLTQFLKEHHNHQKFYAIGEDVFIQKLIDEGFYFTENPKEIDIVLVTLDRAFTFEKLEIASKAIENGAIFYAANIDNTCPVEDGEIIDAGSIISALEKRTHKKLEKHFGKPSSFMIEFIKRKISFDNDKTIIIGDRLETDIAMGNQFGIDTALVATGVCNVKNGNANIQPTYNLQSVYDLIRQKL